MTKEEKLERIKKLKTQIDNVATDFVALTFDVTDGMAYRAKASEAFQDLRSLLFVYEMFEVN